MREAAEELRQLEMLCLEEIGRQFLRSTGPWLPRSHQQGPTATRGHGWPQDWEGEGTCRGFRRPPW